MYVCMYVCMYVYMYVFYKFYKDAEITKFETKLHSMKSQGRVKRECNEVDPKFTSAFLKNHKLSDDIVSFICRGRLQLLQTNSLLHIYYNVGKSCRLCNHPFDTASHVLNGCTRIREVYQKRHNRIVDLIHEKIKNANNESTVLKDRVLTPGVFGDEPRPQFATQNTRPDIVLIDRENKQVIITEVSIPFDCHSSTCYQEKFNKYFPLSLEINNMGYRTQIIVLVIGSLGHIHSKFVSGLLKNNVVKHEAKFLARYCAISAMIGSYKAWKSRCRLSPRVDN